MDRQTEKQKQTDGRTELTSILEVKCMFCSNLKGAKTASLKLGCVVPYSCLFLNIPTCKLTELSSNWFITAFARKKPQMILIICYNKPVLRIRIRIRSDPVFLGHPDPDPGKYRIRILYPQKDPWNSNFLVT